MSVLEMHSVVQCQKGAKKPTVLTWPGWRPIVDQPSAAKPIWLAPDEEDVTVILKDVSRRTFLISGAAAAALVWLHSRGAAPAVAASVAPTAAVVERPHRTLLGVL